MLNMILKSECNFHSKFVVASIQPKICILLYGINLIITLNRSLHFINVIEMFVKLPSSIISRQYDDMKVYLVLFPLSLPCFFMRLPLRSEYAKHCASESATEIASYPGVSTGMTQRQRIILTCSRSRDGSTIIR